MVVGRDIDDLPKNAANYTALTPLWFLERAAVVHPTRKSVVHGSRHYTWLQTYQRCRRMASALNNHSIGLGTTVIPYTPNSFSLSEADKRVELVLLLSIDHGYCVIELILLNLFKVLNFSLLFITGIEFSFV